MRNQWQDFLDFVDPERKGPLCWKYGWKGILFILLVTWWVHQMIISPTHHALGGFLYLFTIGVHEAGHPLFRMLFFGNFKMTIFGGTVMEILVPTLGFFYFLHKGREIQADVCLLLLSIACYSIGHYSGCSLDPTITLLNATGPEAVPDWDYMHKWLGTEGYEGQFRQTFYWLSAILAGWGSYLFFAHFWAWTNPDHHDYNKDDDGHNFFFTRE